MYFCRPLILMFGLRPALMAFCLGGNSLVEGHIPSWAKLNFVILPIGDNFTGTGHG
jgi:hypothetical protein